MSFDAVRLAQTGLGPIAYHELGSGEPLIMHHGGESHKGQYEGFAWLLPPGIRAISYDQRDVGSSFRATRPYGIGDIADDCVALMDALGIEKAHILGFSFGGIVTMHVGVRHPDRVQSLIIGTAPVRFDEQHEALKELVATHGLQTQEELMIQAILSPAGQADPDQVDRVRRMMTGRVSDPGSNRMNAVRGHALDQELRSIVAPTLLVYGSDDPLCAPANGTFIANRIRNAELVTIDGARHGLSSEFKDRVAGLVRTFVLKHPVVS